LSGDGRPPEDGPDATPGAGQSSPDVPVLVRPSFAPLGSDASGGDASGGDAPGSDAPGSDASGSDASDPGPPDADVPDNVIVLPRLDRVAAPAAVESPEEPEPDDGSLRPPPAHLLEGAAEALLFAADSPMKLARVDEWLGHPGESEVHDALLAIRDRLRRGPGGVRLVEVAKGWQLRTDPRFGQWVAAMRGGRPVRLSRAALDTLSIVAYRQPCVRSEVEQLRGVDCGGVLRMLVERGLVQVTGRTSDPGRPLLYGTTPAFLELFGLRDLSDLPTLRDLRELQRDDGRMGPGLFPEEDEPLPAPAPVDPPAAPPRLAPPRLHLPPDPGGPEDREDSEDSGGADDEDAPTT